MFGDIIEMCMVIFFFYCNLYGGKVVKETETLPERAAMIEFFLLESSPQ